MTHPISSARKTPDSASVSGEAQQEESSISAGTTGQARVTGPRLFEPPPADTPAALPTFPSTASVPGPTTHGNAMHAAHQQNETLFHRHPKNPILTAADWPYGINSVFNAGATLLPDGATLLLCRVEDRRGHSHLCAARSKNGVDGWEIDPAPTLMPDPKSHPEELWGIEDPRITFVPELGKYVIVYTSFSRSGPGVSLAVTEDFRTFERYGDILPPENKDAALLPRRIGNYWALINRPVSGSRGANIWLSYSPDLRHWGSHRVILEARRGAWWDANKVGLSPPPIETPQGWLVLYHGVRHTAAGCIYRLGLALFDLQTPERCLRRGDSWIFTPEAPYERFGDVDNVVFPCGYTIAPDGDTVNLYYGGADSCIALATGSVSALLEWLVRDGKPDGESKE